MHLDYNAVPLGIVRVVEHSAVPEYDPTGLDYLWTRVKLTVEAVYNPQRTVTGHRFVTARGDPLADTAAVVGQLGSPVLTDLALRHRLSQPRRHLKVWFDSNIEPVDGDAAAEVWIDSPRPDPPGSATHLPCDPAGGPWVHDLSVTEAMGNARTFMVRATFETCVTDCRPGTPQVPLLSNQWTCSLSYDADGYSARRFVGLAVFRRDLLEKRQYTPDDFRLDLLPPVPGGAVRTITDLTTHADGYTYSYDVTDAEQPIDYIDRPSVRNSDGTVSPTGRGVRNVRSINCVVQRTLASSGGSQIIGGVISGLIEGVADAARTSAMMGLVGGAEAMFSGGATLALQGAAIVGRPVATNLMGTLPKYREVATCRVRGNKLATKAELVRLAYSVAFSALTTPAGTTTLGRLFRGAVLPPIPTLPGVPAQAQPAFVADQMFKHMLSIMPPASVLDLKFDLFDKWVEVTVQQEWSGLVDWVQGNVGGSVSAVLGQGDTVPESVTGADWPLWLKTTGLVLSGGAAAELALAGLPPLPDAKLAIASGREATDRATGAPPPLAAPQPGGLQPPVVANRQGTNLAALVAAGLTTPCQTFRRPAADLAALPTAPLTRPALTHPADHRRAAATVTPGRPRRHGRCR